MRRQGQIPQLHHDVEGEGFRANSQSIVWYGNIKLSGPTNTTMAGERTGTPQGRRRARPVMAEISHQCQGVPSSELALSVASMRPSVGS